MSELKSLKELSKKSKIILIICTIIVLCLILAFGRYYYLVSLVLSRRYEPDIIISSPDGRYDLVVREWSYGMGGGAEIYIRKRGQDNSWKEQRIGSTKTDDGYNSFARGNYYVEWESDKVTIYYYTNFQIEKTSDRSTWRGVFSYEFESG